MIDRKRHQSNKIIFYNTYSDLEQKNTEVLMKLENFAERHDELLNRLIQLNENILKLNKFSH